MTEDFIDKLIDSIKMNKTYCFDTYGGKLGWCATCKVQTNSKILKKITFV